MHTRSKRWPPAATLLSPLLALGAACGTSPQDNTSATKALPDSGLIFASDLSGAEAGTDAGAAPSSCPGGAFCPCGDNAECDSGMCIWTPDGQQCTKTCVDACPEGFKCAQVPQGMDVINVCVPRWGHICEPCAADSDCAMAGLGKALCVDLGGEGSFCGAPCAADADCPLDYTCGDAKGAEGTGAKQCVRAGGDACPCTKYATDNGLSTACFVSGPQGGECHGVRRCEAEGLGKCTVPPATKETCDGLDNDCDGKTDNLACDDKNPCTLDTCDPSDETNPCAHKNVEQPCDADDNLCTAGDICVEGVCTPGAPKVCDDKNPCTLDTCKPDKGCIQTPDDSKPCDDENPCTVGDACKDGGCAAGKAKVCTSTDPCVAAKCDLTAGGKCAYTKKPEAAPCDDGDPCTANTKCVSGNCTGQAGKCDDGNACTSDTCDQAAGCKHTPAADGAPCSDGAGCTQGGGCKGGTCTAGKPIACDDQDKCTDDKCDVKAGKCVYTPIVGCGGNCTTAAHCKSDGNPCTTAACVLLKCAHQPNAAACDDGNPCTDSDACAGGICKGQGKSCDDNNPCTLDTCDPQTKQCKHTPNAAGCDDGNACTQGDTCSGGACKPGAAACVKGDKCKASGDCVTGACVGGVCVSALKCGPLKTISGGQLGDVIIDQNATFNTGAGTLSWGGKTIGGSNKPGVQVISQQGAGSPPQIRVLHFKSLTIKQGVTLKVTGTLAAALIAQGKIVVDGKIDARGANGSGGKTNASGMGGPGGPGAYKGGHFVSGQGCIPNAGKGFGPGGGSAAACGGGGSKGGSGGAGGGGGGGGGGCGGVGGAGGGHATMGLGGMAGGAATSGSNATGFAGTPGSGGAGCFGTQGGGAGPNYGQSTLAVMLGGSGGSGGGYGGFAGFGGQAQSTCNATTFGCSPGFSGGGGGGGGGGGVVLLCATEAIQVGSAGVIDVRGGDGGSGGSSGSSGSGKNPSYYVKCTAGGGGGGGRSGGGGGGGGGSGGALFLTAGSILHNGQLQAGGGSGGGPGFAFSGGFGGYGKNGGGNGGKGGSGGKGGKGGDGGLGWIRIEAGQAVMNGTHVGKVTQGGI